MMKTLTSALILSLAAVGVANAAPVASQHRQAAITSSLSADGAPYAADFLAIPSTKSRAQVVEELEAARAAGEIHNDDIGYPYLPVAVSTKTREQVRQELREYRAQHRDTVILP